MISTIKIYTGQLVSTVGCFIAAGPLCLYGLNYTIFTMKNATLKHRDYI